MSRKASAPKLRIIEGGLPPEKEWTAAELRRIYFPTVKALPFVKLKPNAKPEWHPESFWNVEPSGRGRWDRDYALGKTYALQAVAAMKEDGTNVLGSIFRDMIEDGVKRKKLPGYRRHNPAVAGFLHQLGKMFF